MLGMGDIAPFPSKPSTRLQIGPRLLLLLLSGRVRYRRLPCPRLLEDRRLLPLFLRASTRLHASPVSWFHTRESNRLSSWMLGVYLVFELEQMRFLIRRQVKPLKMKPLASGPTIASGFQPASFILWMNRSVVAERRVPSDRTGVMSRNMIPSIGKSGTVRTASLNFCVISSDMLFAPVRGVPFYILNWGSCI